jgi:ribose transport system ATP-binding protein
VLGAAFGSLPRRRRGQVAGKPLRVPTSPSARRCLRRADRKTGGGVMTMSARGNLTLPTSSRSGRAGRVARPRSRDQGWFEAVGNPANATEEPLASSTAATSKKIPVRKWLSQKPTVFLLDEPTRGRRSQSDSTASWSTRQGRRGGDQLQRLEELADLCDRVLVIVGGKISSVLEGA